MYHALSDFTNGLVASVQYAAKLGIKVTTGARTAKSAPAAGPLELLHTHGLAVGVPPAARRVSKGTNGARTAKSAPAAVRPGKTLTSGAAASAPRAARRVMKSTTGARTARSARFAARLFAGQRLTSSSFVMQHSSEESRSSTRPGKSAPPRRKDYPIF